jgi:CRISPR/Cas system-associated protein Cas10 (large subunit of type III CRISPR-Cas system)
VIRRLLCSIGAHNLRAFRPGERICTHCGDRFLIQEIERNNMRCGQWVYVGKATPEQRAALAAVEGQP